MRISYVPEEILKAPVDCKYHFCNPFKTAIYNFKVSVYASHIKEHDKFQENADKVEEVAKPAIEAAGTPPKHSCCNRIAHFFAHVGIGLLLLIPIVNMIAFMCLAIKAKEYREPPPPPEESMQDKATEKPSDKPSDKPAEKASEKPKEKPLEKLSEKLSEKPQEKKETQPQTKVISPPQAQPKIQTPKEQPAQPQTNTQPSTPVQATKLTAQPEDPVIRNLHRNVGSSPNPAIAVREQADIVIDLFFPLFVSEIPEDVVKDISTIFSLTEPNQPKELPPQKKQAFFALDDWKDKTKLPTQRRMIRDSINFRITTGAHGKGALGKSQNAENNLKYFRQFLDGKFTDHKGAPFLATFNATDVRVQIRENPYNQILSGVFGLPHEEFKELLPKFEFYENEGLIKVNPNIMNG